MDPKRRAELEKILLTSDGKGRRIKEEALAELMTNAREDGYQAGWRDGESEGHLNGMNGWA